MKNIALFGSPRAGKSTLAKMITKKYPHYRILAGDTIRIRHAFQQLLPHPYHSRDDHGSSGDFPSFLAELFTHQLAKNQGRVNYIIDTCDITPEQAQKLFRRDDTILLFLGTPHLTAQSHLQEIRKFETSRDWTHLRSDKHLLNHCAQWLNRDQAYAKTCQTLGIWYVDTSFNREQVLKKTFDQIEQLNLNREYEPTL